ncbi:hypothetical protein [Thaumasiovibrio subtropicus]|uniref:hypothetical protein n=1 Tax=Thaumasiovibrio subtropicus TaxID=1891207 RepID=UPI000B35CDE0|nr:hypothetical protein [Thaumasiovibrio subtropicus]
MRLRSLPNWLGHFNHCSPFLTHCRVWIVIAILSFSGTTVANQDAALIDSSPLDGLHINSEDIEIRQFVSGNGDCDIRQVNLDLSSITQYFDRAANAPERELKTAENALYCFVSGVARYQGDSACLWQIHSDTTGTLSCNNKTTYFRCNTESCAKLFP